MARFHATLSGYSVHAVKLFLNVFCSNNVGVCQIILEVTGVLGEYFCAAGKPPSVGVGFPPLSTAENVALLVWGLPLEDVRCENFLPDVNTSMPMDKISAIEAAFAPLSYFLLYTMSPADRLLLSRTS
ncbi:hypothetical protein [Nereida ignava]|uniref:hypothetical protein n=1 Tax=Nereida ignava TaxID=282199 RepID=UPI0030F9D9FF